MAITPEILLAVQPLLGKATCRQRVGQGRTLSLGFGEKIFHGNPKLADPFYGEWEIGTYNAAWRFIRAGKIVIGSQDVFDSVADFNMALQKLPMGSVAKIDQLTNTELRLSLSDGASVEFICASSDKDEMFHIFAPEKQCIEYRCVGGWKIGPSNAPWT